MEKKRLIDLTISDLLDNPIWKHWTEDNVEYVSPSDRTEISDTSTSGHLVRTDFSLNNGTKWIGICSPQDPSGLDYIQPVILTENGHVELWRDNDWSIEDQEKALQKLGLEWEKVFPITYRTAVKCDNEFYQSKLLNFNKEEIKTVPNKG